MDFSNFQLPLGISIPTAWENHAYRQTVLIVLSIIFGSALIVFFFHKELLLRSILGQH